MSDLERRVERLEARHGGGFQMEVVRLTGDAEEDARLVAEARERIGEDGLLIKIARVPARGEEVDDGS